MNVRLEGGGQVVSVRNSLLRTLSYLQPASLSAWLHDSQYRDLLGSLDGLPQGTQEHRHRILHDREYRLEALNGPQMKLDHFLAQFPTRNIAVDIGSGCGWIADYLSQRFQRVIAIEPSEDALKIAERTFGLGAHHNIEYVNSSAYRALRDLTLDQPVLVVTGVVLSHLPNKSVVKICQTLNDIWRPGSVGVFSEAWGLTHHQPMWHVRTKTWWESLFPGCVVDFFGPKSEGQHGEHLGFAVSRN